MSSPGKCVECYGRINIAGVSVDDFANYSEDQFVIEEVMQPIYRQTGNPRFWEHICWQCFINKIDRERDNVAGMTIDDHIG